MLKVFCWRCGTRIKKGNILGMGHFDKDIGKYQGKSFVAFRCPECKKVRYQILENKLPLKKENNRVYEKSNNQYQSSDYDNKIDINQVIDFYEFLSGISTVEGFLKRCNSTAEVTYSELDKPLVQPLDVYNVFNELNSSNLKRVLILILDNDHCLLDWEFLGEKTGRSASFEPKVIFQSSLLKEKEVSIIIAENLKDEFHKPSQKEILITKRLIKAGKILGIDFLDHIIIDNNGFYSFEQMNLI